MFIIAAANGLFLEGRFRPVFVGKDFYETLLDASIFTGLSVRQIVAAANKRATVATPKVGRKRFRWPTLKELKNRYPLAAVKFAGGFNPARPTTMHYQDPAGNVYDVDLSSLTGMRNRYHMSHAQQEAIRSRTPGHAKYLPPGVKGITVHSPKYRPKTPPIPNFAVHGPLFNVQKNTAGTFDIDYIGPQNVPTFYDIPEAVLDNCNW